MWGQDSVASSAFSKIKEIYCGLMNSDTLNNNNNVSMWGRIIMTRQNVFNKDMKVSKNFNFHSIVVV